MTDPKLFNDNIYSFEATFAWEKKHSLLSVKGVVGHRAGVYFYLT